MENCINRTVFLVYIVLHSENYPLHVVLDAFAIGITRPLSLLWYNIADKILTPSYVLYANRIADYIFQLYFKRPKYPI
jgi:hypothetical protein